MLNIHTIHRRLAFVMLLPPAPGRNGGLCGLDDSKRDRNRRIVSAVSCNGADASAEQVRRGLAWVFVKYASADSPLHGMQETARTARAGLWADAHPMEPWVWRNRLRKR
jgi:endonuclease YncB( thermonuclease family)